MTKKEISQLERELTNYAKGMPDHLLMYGIKIMRLEKNKRNLKKLKVKLLSK